MKDINFDKIKDGNDLVDAFFNIKVKLKQSKDNSIVKDNFKQVCGIALEEYEFIEWYFNKKGIKIAEKVDIKANKEAVEDTAYEYASVQYILNKVGDKLSTTMKSNLYNLIKRRVQQSNRLTRIITDKFKKSGGVISEESIERWKNLSM